MFRKKDFIYPPHIENPSYTCKPYLERVLSRTIDISTPIHRLYIKVPVFCKAMCYARGSDQDRKVRKFYDIAMLDFPGGNCYPCINYRDALAEIEQAKKAGNPYAEETLVMMERAACEYWITDEDEVEDQQG